MLLDDWKNKKSTEEADILPASGTGKSNTLGWHHTLFDLML